MSDNDIFKDLLARARKDADSGQLMELENMAEALGYTAKDIAKSLASRYADKGISGKDSEMLLRLGVLVGWYAALAKGKPKKPWWKRLGRM